MKTCNYKPDCKESAVAHIGDSLYCKSCAKVAGVKAGKMKGREVKK